MTDEVAGAQSDWLVRWGWLALAAETAATVAFVLKDVLAPPGSLVGLAGEAAWRPFAVFSYSAVLAWLGIVGWRWLLRRQHPRVRPKVFQVVLILGVLLGAVGAWVVFYDAAGQAPGFSVIF